VDDDLDFLLQIEALGAARRAKRPDVLRLMRLAGLDDTDTYRNLALKRAKTVAIYAGGLLPMVRLALRAIGKPRPVPAEVSSSKTDPAKLTAEILANLFGVAYIDPRKVIPNH
jgi:hypothetical protein